MHSGQKPQAAQRACREHGEHGTGPSKHRRTARPPSGVPPVSSPAPDSARRLAAVTTALIACGALTAPPLPAAPSGSSQTVSAREVITVPGPGPDSVPTPNAGTPLELQNPDLPEITSAFAEEYGSMTPLFADSGLIAQPIGETETGAGENFGRSPEPRRPRGRYQWPTGVPATVVENFDPPAIVWGRGHRGVDLAAAEGTQIHSAAAGTVVFAGMVAGRPVVSIDHADGIRTTYEPVEPAVGAGDTVDVGQVIGTLLPGHRSDGVCALHWGARTGPKTYINPLRLLQPAVIRLKPVQ